MTINYTTLLGLTEPVTGTQSGTWGSDINTGLTDYVEAAIAGAQVISGSQTAVTLSVTTGSSSAPTTLSQAGSGATGSSQYQIIRCTGNPAGLLTITAPASDKTYVVINATSTSQSVKIVGAGPTTGVTIVSGERAFVAWNGSDFVKVGGAAGGTNTQVQYNNNGVFGGSADLTWDGSTLATTGLTASGAVTLSATTQNIALGTSQVGGTWTAGGASQTGAITLDQSTKTHTLNIGTGATENALTKTINLGTAGVSGSTTAINIGSAVSGATTNVTLNGTVQPGVVISGSSSGDALRITQTGAGNALLVEDAANPDSTPFVVTAAGDVGIGTSSPGAKLELYTAGTVNLRLNGSLGGGNTVDFYNYIPAAANNGFAIALGGTVRAAIDSSGNLGLGVTPSAWSNRKAFEGFYGGALSFDSVFLQTAVSSNCYYNGTNWIYKVTNWGATRYETGDISNGVPFHKWYVAASGTAGNTISFTQAMTLDASGNLVVGSTSGNYRLTAARAAGGTQLAVTTATANGSSASPLNIDIDFLGYNDDTKARIRASDASANTAESPLAFWTRNSAGTLAERARITSVGDFGIGTTSPSSILDVQKAGTAAATTDLLELTNSGNAASMTNTGTGILFNQFYYDATTPAVADAGRIAVKTTGNWTSTASTQDAYMTFETALDGTVAERARITSDGDLLVGTTNASLQAGGVRLKNGGGNLGEIALANNSGVSDYVARFLWGTTPTLVGNITVSSTATAYNTSSDRRLKENIFPAEDAGAVIDAIEVVEHDWKAGGHTRYGVIAQDLNAVAPEAVSAGDDGDEIERTWSVDYSKLVPMLIKEIQSLRQRVALLEGN